VQEEPRILGQVGDHANDHPRNLNPIRRGRNVGQVGYHSHYRPGELNPNRRHEDLIPEDRGRNLGQDVDDNFSYISSIRWRDVSEERRFQADWVTDHVEEDSRRNRSTSNKLEPRRFHAGQDKANLAEENPKRDISEERRFNADQD